MMFKCPGFYCVPWSYVCDGKWDCPGGSEESYRYGCEKERNCTNMYRCRNSKICIHLGNVCEDCADCPLNDDESSCEVSRIKCPKDCVCLSLAIKCINSSVSADHLINKFPYVAISVLFPIKLWQSLDDTIWLFAAVTHMYFVRDEIVSICPYVFHWKDLKLLDLSYNHVSHLRTRCFHNLLYLTLIRLNNNNISVVKSHAFNNVPNLNLLDLSFNQIESLDFEIFDKISEVNRLLFNGTDVKQINDNAFKNVGLKSVFTLNYDICCIVPISAECHYLHKPWHFSCSNLLASKTMRHTLLAILFFLILLNSSSLVIHLYFNDYDSSTYLILAVNISDMFCTMYTGILLAADFYYEGNFFVYERQWRSSKLCFSLFGLALSFSFVAPCLLFILSLARLLVVMYPVDSVFKKTSFTVKCIASCWIFIMVITVSFTILADSLLKELPIGLCLPFCDPDNTSLLFKYITWLTAILQLMASVCIIAMYVMLTIRRRESGNKFNIPSHSSNTSMIVQLVVVSSSNILCWLPSSGIYLASLFMSKYPTAMVVWATIAVLPINSIINPFVFVLTTLRKAKRQGWRRKS